MDPAWVSIIIGVFASLVTAVVNYAALKSWMARREERERGMEMRVDNLEADIEVQSLGMQKLDVRVSVLEDRSPTRQPLDYAR